ncbi:uncharacterized protein LOC131003838 isoform X2 [Salvia miltiorrhiza]|uniref:uncharacterized protein LOC131003838 isoform X2 n=1 Tax=Salvia miltiorrhiza TaxID=226208 RepID=UPI0025AD1663|nr:uncharacterized protein LOC131003838 isoform X2 [Salvia miltiorrhiza]
MAQIRDVLHPWLQQIWEVLHPWLHPTLQIHDSRLFLYKWALEIAERGKSCRSFFVLGARTGCMGIETKKIQESVNSTFYRWRISGCCSTAYLPHVPGTSCG